MVRRRGRLRPRAKAPGRPPCFPAAMYSRRMPRIATCRPADAVRLLADGFGRGRLKRASLEARKRCRTWPAQIPEAALFRSPYRAALRVPATAGTVYGAAYWRRGSCQTVGQQSLTARPIGRAARHGGRRPAPARAASGRRGMQRSVRLPGRHDPLACRRRIRRRERCWLRPARCMVPPLGGTVSAWQSPGGRGGSCRRVGVQRAWRHLLAALYGRPTGRLKMGGGRSTRRMAGAKDAEWRPFNARPWPGRPPPGNRRAACCPAGFRRISCGAGRALDRRAKARRNGAANRRHGFRPPGRADRRLLTPAYRLGFSAGFGGRQPGSPARKTRFPAHVFTARHHNIICFSPGND